MPKLVLLTYYLMSVTRLVAEAELIGEDLGLNPLEHILGEGAKNLNRD